MRYVGMRASRNSNFTRTNGRMKKTSDGFRNRFSIQSNNT